MTRLPQRFVVLIAFTLFGLVDTARSWAKPSDFVLLCFEETQSSSQRAWLARELRELQADGWIVRQVDAAREPHLVTRWQVDRWPTWVVLKHGKEVDRIVQPTARGEAAQRIAALDHREDQRPSTANDPMQATVRIRVEDAQHISFGTGTIIDQHGDEALVLTCGHLFRDVQSGTQIQIEAQWDGRWQSMAGHVVDFQCQETDIGLVSFRPGRTVPVARLLPRGVTPQEMERVASFGCDGGAEPSRRDSHITKLNRYLGPANIEVAKAPVQGRSGGGLFNARGELIGVCYAADAERDEGLYSGPQVVYEQLARLGLTRLYEDAPNSFAAHSSASQPSAATAARGALASSPVDSFPDTRPLGSWRDALPTAAAAAAQSASRAPSSTSTIRAIVRGPDGREQTIDIPNASPELVRTLQANASANSMTAQR